MGSPFQEVLQGRGGKKRQVLGLARSFSPHLFLALLIAGLYTGLPAARPVVFSITFVLYLSSIVFGGLKLRGLPVLLVLGGQSLFEALFQVNGYEAFHLVQVPVAVLSALVLSPLHLAALMLSQPLLHSRELTGPQAAGTIQFLAVLLVSGLPVGLYAERLRGKVRDYSLSFEKLQAQAQDLADSSPSFNDDTLMSRYFTDVLEVEEDIMGLLRIAEKALVADSVNLFINEGDELSFRLSSCRTGVAAAREGLIYRVFKTREPLLHYSESPGRDTRPGYSEDGKVATFIGIPVVEESTVLGVLCADSARYRAFGRQDLGLMELVGRELSKILRRQRIYSQIQMSYKSLRVLHEASVPLSKTLDLPVLCRRIAESAEMVSGGKAVLLLKKGRSYELHGSSDTTPWDGKVASLKGSLLEMVQSNREPVYHPDISGFKTDALPFQHRGVRSVLALPVLHGTKFVGVLVLLSGKKKAFNSLQISLLGILVNHASVSISNVLLHEEIKSMAFTDGLTGLFNHRHFKEKVAVELKRSERFNEPLSLLLTDIDHFKRVNDTYGHPVGDAVLKGVAGIIRKTVRNIDIPARYGGEEFAILIVRTDARGARRIAERIRANIKSHEFKAGGHQLRVTVSIGIASYPADVAGRDELIEKADEALYSAKERGRDRTVLYGDLG